MKASNKAYILIKAFEGLRLTAYKCPAGVLTIGWGHTKTVERGMTVNKEYAEILLTNDIAEFEDAINKLVKVTINQNQFDALVSFVFNVGTENFKNSTLLKKINAKDFTGAAKEFLRWNKARKNGTLVVMQGLQRRREMEKDLFENEN